VNVGTVVLGLVNGSVIGLLAAGFVLVYRSNRFLNLAHAQLGAVSSVLFAKVVNDNGWNFWPALVGCIAIGLGVGFLVERFLVAPVRRASSSPVRLLLLSIGISQLLLALTFVPFLTPNPESSKPFPQPFESNLEIGGVVLSGMSVLTVLVVPVLLIALTVFLEYSALGRQIRAAASNPQAARLCGISIDRVSRVTWAVAGGLSAMSAILSGPNAASGNLAAVGPTLLVQTLGAAAFGAFVSIPWAVGGGLGIGVLYQVMLSETLDAGDAQLTIFGLILVVILLRGKAIAKVFAAAGAAVPERPIVRMPAALRDRPFFRAYRRWLGFGGLFVAGIAPHLPFLRTDGNRFLLALILIHAMIGISLTVLVGWAGQVSLGHFAVVGLGAFLTARWISDGWTVLGLILVVGLVGAAVTVVIGLPALRVRGLTLVVTTVGFAVVAPQWLFLQRSVGGATPFTTPVDPPSLGAGLGRIDSQQKLYYVVLAALVVIVLAVGSLRRSNAGRAILAVRDNERASSSLGMTPSTVKLSALALSGWIAAVTGVFWAVAWQRVSPVQFGPEVSTAVLSIPVIGGLGSLAGALVASVMLYAPTFFLAPKLDAVLGEFGRNPGFLLAFAGLGVVGTMRQYPNGVAGAVASSWQKYLDKKAGGRPAEAEATDVHVPTLVGAAVTAPVATADPTSQATPLVVEQMEVSFGGVHALQGASIVVRPGEIVGLIGPNGAGKTTLMNAISGFVSPKGGSVQLFGEEVSDLAPDIRPTYGMARTFQDASLFGGLTLAETIQVGVARGAKTGVVGSMLAAPWVRVTDREFQEQAAAILRSFNLDGYADTLTAELSTGTRRICDLALQVAARPKLLLLDEPTGGVAQREAEAFGPLVRRIRDELDCAVLIIEHDMPLLMGLCDRVYAMEAGRVIAEGTPEEIRQDPLVIRSYLGEDTTAIDRSGGTSKKKTTTSRRRQPVTATSGRTS
jgi:ABC-type branched-subunit amino acid transport system ATPase component/ABC-type branched-subunit amino acid transport system permease subunit